MKTGIINKQIANVFILCAAILAFLSGVGGTVILVRDITKYGFSPTHPVMYFIFVIWLLAYGIFFKKSIVCAIAILVLHIIIAILRLIRGSDLTLIIGLIPLLITVTYILGIIGTFAYHNMYEKEAKWKK